MMVPGKGSLRDCCTHKARQDDGFERFKLALVHPSSRVGAARRFSEAGWGAESGSWGLDRGRCGQAIAIVRELRCKTTAEDAGLAGDADSRADGGTDERQRACEAAPFGRLLRCAPKDRGKVLAVRELDTCPSLNPKP
jgi:hypothetical protein